MKSNYSKVSNVTSNTTHQNEVQVKLTPYSIYSVYHSDPNNWIIHSHN